jgi:hypothetical protein
VSRLRPAAVLAVPLAVTAAGVALAAAAAGVLSWTDALAPDDAAPVVRVVPTPRPTGWDWPDPETAPSELRKLQRLAAERCWTFYGRALMAAPTVPPVCPPVPPPLTVPPDRRPR